MKNIRRWARIWGLVTLWLLIVPGSAFAISAVSNLQVIGSSGSTATLRWGSVGDNDFARYEVYYRTTTGVTSANGTLWGTANDANLATKTLAETTITGLPTGNTYYFVVYAIDNAEGLSVVSNEAWALLSQAKQDTTPPAVATDIALQKDENGNIKITWTDPADADFKEVGILKGVNDGPINGIPLFPFVQKGVQEFTDTNVADGNAYTYIVRTYDGKQNTTNSAVFTITLEMPSVPEPEPEPEPVGPQTHDMEIRDLVFATPELTVQTGDTVRWTNKDGLYHTVTFDDASADSGDIAPSAAFERIFGAPGTYMYHCSRHPAMTGTIVVTGEAQATDAEPEQEVVTDEPADESAGASEPATGEPLTEPESGTGAEASGQSEVNDIPDGHWAKTGVDKVRAAGLMEQKKPGEFRLGDTMTRAEAAKIIAKALGSGELSPGTGESAFKDVPQGAWFAPYVRFVLDRGIVAERELFEPGRAVNRAELFVMILKAKGIASETADLTARFADIPGGQWFDGVATVAFQNGLLEGKPKDGKFYFDGTGIVTRAEAAVIFTKGFLE